MKKFSFIAVALAMFAVVACKPTPGEQFTPEFAINAVESYEISAEGEEISFDINANVAWTVTSDAEWLDIAPASGEGESTVLIAVAENETYDEREATVTVAVSSKEYAASLPAQTFTVTQAAAKALVVGEGSYTVGAQASTIDIQLSTNVAYEVTTTEEWLTVAEATRGLEEKTVSIAVAANETGEERVGYVEIKSELGTDKVKVTQTESAVLTVDETEKTVKAAAGSVSITLTTNVDYTLSTNADWLTLPATRAVKTKTIIIGVAENESYDSRTGVVTITSEDASVDVTITQEPVRAIVIDELNYEVGMNGGEITVNLQANVEYEVETSADWIVKAGTRGLEAYSETFTIAANNDAAREGTITFTTELGKDVVTVKQFGTDTVIEFPDARMKTLMKNACDTDKSGDVSIAEALAVTKLAFSKQNSNFVWTSETSLKDVTGLEYFTNLEELDLSTARITSVDLSTLTKLKKLTICYTGITEIDLSKNTELEYLNLGDSKITAIDLSNNTKLTELQISGAKLTALDVTALTNLKVLNCAYNQIAALDLSKNTALEAVYCNGNKIAVLSVKDLAGLKRLQCEHNQIASLDVTGNSALTAVHCGRNALTELKVAGLANLVYLSAYHNSNLAAVDMSGLAKLNYLSVAGTGISSLSTPDSPELWVVSADRSKVATADFSANAALRCLVIEKSYLKDDLSLTGNLALGCLFADNAELKTITLPETINLNKVPTSFYKNDATAWAGGNTESTERKTYDLSAAGTANCYVIAHENSFYTFKATVKGNGMPTLSGDKAALKPAKARILWAQAQPTVDPITPGWPQNYGDTSADSMVVASSVTLENGVVTFRTGEEMPNGNAGIVVTDKNDNILWSWHLWFVKGYDPAAHDVLVTAKDVNTTFMDRNLGATVDPCDRKQADANDYTSARGLYYQWGRKDPFPGHVHSRGYASRCLLYAADGSVTNPYSCYSDGRAFKVTTADLTATTNDVNDIVAYTAAHPMEFIGGNAGSYYQWVSNTASVSSADGEWSKLWGNAEHGGNVFDKGGIKTMYDPCPVGYRVPSTGDFTFITSHGDQSSNGYGNNMREWQYNCVETIWTDEGAADGGDKDKDGFGYKNSYGLHFYVKGVKTATEGVDASAQNRGTAPEDETTLYFPGQGFLNYTYSNNPNGGDVIVHCNAAVPNSANAYRMKATQDGNFYYAWTNIDWGQSQGIPVRCILDTTTPEVPPVTPDEPVEGGVDFGGNTGGFGDINNIGFGGSTNN